MGLLLDSCVADSEVYFTKGSAI